MREKKITTDFSIRTFKGGFDKNLSYILKCMRNNIEIIIDPAIKPDIIIPFLKTSPIAILVTHTHMDHISYLDEYLSIYPEIKVVGHPKSKIISLKDNFIPINDNSLINIGNLNIKIIHTPGHYFDSICYYLQNIIFTGDTLFVGRTGRTVDKKSDIEKLYDSVYNKILPLPPETIIYPGHDYGKKLSISIEDNIQISKLLRAKSKNDFYDRMSEYEKTRIIGQ